jgi:DDE superfamily endonuclease
MSTWVDEVTTDSKAHFTVSSNGWSNNAIGLVWLQKVFERYTKPARETQKRLLIVDGHSSHVNMAFVDWADQHGIILLILPPHTTHRLQPLDVGLFQPLSTNYSWELDQLMNESGGHVTMTKSFFWPMFKRAWDKAFTEKNIQSAFCKSGIWPTDGSYIIKTITRPVAVSPEKSASLRTPKSAKAIRRFYAAYDKEPTVDKVKKLFTTTLHLSAQVSCLQHENRGLYKSIELQKKKGRQGVRLNLAGQSNKDIVDCYSPAQVVKAREYQEEKEALKAAEEQAKNDRKIKRAANALRKKEEEVEKAKRKAEREAKAAQNQSAKDLATANQPAKKALKKKPVSTIVKAKKAAPTVLSRRKVSTPSGAGARKLVKSIVVAEIEGVVAPAVAGGKTSTRTINLL